MHRISLPTSTVQSALRFVRSVGSARTVIALAIAVAQFVGSAHAETWQIPRATGSMPVRVLVECLSSSCDVAEHCATPDAWAGITGADFSRSWDLEYRQVITTPLRSNGRHVCAVALRDGAAALTGLRYHRERNSEGQWVTRSMTMDWYFREMELLAPSDLAPNNAYRFYQVVKGRKLCSDPCGPNDDTVYFRVSEEYHNIEALGVREATVFTSEGNSDASWAYEKGPANQATVELDFTWSGVDETCWISLTFETETSGTSSTRCRVGEGDSGTWQITDRP